MPRLRRGSVGILALLLAAGVLCASIAGAEGRVDRPTPYSAAHQLDLNRATLDQILQLPISAELARNIYDFRTYRAYFDRFYDLLKVEGMTPEDLKRIKPLVFITPVFEVIGEELGASERRARDLAYVVQRLLSQEGSSEELADEYFDRIKIPVNVNGLDFFDLISYQNVSPVDAVAVLKEKQQSGRIENQRQMRSSPGISYWGYRNLRDYMRYDDPGHQKLKVTGDYQVRMYNTPYLLDDADLLTEPLVGDSRGVSGSSLENFRNFDLNTYAGRLDLDSSNPYLTNKLRLRLGSRFKAAFIGHRNLGENDAFETAKVSVSAESFDPVETPLGAFRVHHAVVGNYRLSFGQGLFMDSTDFFMPRKTGYGYSIRPIGLRPDISRNDEFTLRGAAVEASLGRARGTLFYSRDDKDAILNPDGSFNRYFTMRPRLDNGILKDIRRDIADGVFADRGDTNAYLPMRDVMDEKLLGANLKYEFVPGTYVGVSGMQINYDNNVSDSDVADRFNPDPSTLVIDQGRLEDRDAEVGKAYNSLNLGNYRRLWGAEAQTVFSNVSLAAEYGKLETDADPSHGALTRIFSAGPDAMIANAYIQYENFNLLALYRDYDIGYDNPYNRAFAEDQRYEQTLMDSPFRLKNPLWSQLSLGNPQPKGERGWFFSTRYQFTRAFTLTGLEFDTWKRKADDADLRRLTLRAEYKPIFPIRFRIRHRISSRHENRPADVRNFVSWDSRIEMRANLSKYDQIRFLYSTSNTEFAPRPRLNGPAGGGDAQGDSTSVEGIPSKAIQASVTHNFSDFLSVTFSTELYDGFLYNFEDNEFIVVDGNGYRNWFMLRSRLSENLSWRLKWTTDHQLARTFVDIRNFGSLVPPTPDATNARGDRTSYRFQLDYSF